jgi:SecD/SecF fusion protein
VALVHDLICCTGWTLLTGNDINLVQIGALLTIAGYSVNDTIVIFDRIREYFRQNREGSIKQIMNDAISSTLSRTVLTAVSSLVVIASLALFGGPQVREFCSTLLFGILLGTYSSIFVASPIVYWYTKKRNIDLQGSVQEEESARILSEAGLEREVAARDV